MSWKLKPLTFHNGQFRASIGHVKVPNGTRRAKVFMLGKDERVARIKEQNLRSVYDAIVAQVKERGLKKTEAVWTQEALRLAQRETDTDLSFIEEAAITLGSFNALASDGTELVEPEKIQAAKSSGDPAYASPNLSLYAAIKLYSDHLEARVKGKDLSDANYKRQLFSMKQLKAAVQDAALSGVGHDELQKIKLHFQGRPKTKRGGSMAWQTITTTLSHIRSLFRWLSDTDRWQECKRWEKALLPKKTAEDADDELIKLGGQKFDIFTVDELTKLYAVATPRMRCMLLMGLNTSSESQAVSTLKNAHFKTFDSQGRICRVRHKKSSRGEPIYCEWELWDESWKAAQENFAPVDSVANPNSLAFLGKKGRPLVSPTKSGRVDSINLAFADLCEKAGVRRRGFSMIRKTASNMIEELSDAETADMMLGHSHKSILRKNYNNVNFEKLHAALRKMREKLQPMFDAVKDEQAEGEPAQ